jgi:drug/metabolite transporter (DMT)-like permease
MFRVITGAGRVRVQVARPSDPSASVRGTSHALAYSSMSLVTCLLAGNVLAAKYSLSGFAPSALAELRVAGATVMLVGLFLVRGRHTRVPSALRDWLFLALLGLLGITVNQWCFAHGLMRTSVLHAGLIGGLGPVIILGLSSRREQKGLSVSKLSGMVISVGGITLLVTHKTGSGAQATLIGDSLIVVGTVAFSSYTILEKTIAAKYDDLTLNAFVFGLGALLTLPLAVRSVAAVRWTIVPARAWWGLGFMAGAVR